MKTIKVNATSAKASSRPSFCSGAAAVFAVMLAARSAVAPQVQVLRVARLPRVYNALITSEQRLLPSQADPIIAPVLRPFPVLYHGWPYVAPAAAVGPVRIAAEPLLSAAAGGDVVLVETVTADASTEVRKMVDADASTEVRKMVDADGGAREDAAREQRPAVKNNGPADATVPDVPPPPPPSVPGSRAAAGKKKPEEYPPAPGGFAI